MEWLKANGDNEALQNKIGEKMIKFTFIFS